MPLVYQRYINPHTQLGVWHIAENEFFFTQHVTLPDAVKHPHKRLQHLAGRYLLKYLYPQFPLDIILIADSNKPFLSGDPYHFSISHCGDYAAAIVSTINRVGADVEIPQHKIALIKNKFLKDSELDILKQFTVGQSKGLTLLWSIKEAVYKWHGEGKVDFRTHIDILSLQQDEDEFTAVCHFKKNGVEILTVSGVFFHGNSLAWVIT